MLKFITNLFGAKKAEPTPLVAPYKVEVAEAPVVNSVTSVVNSRKAPAAKPTALVVTGNTPAPKKVKAVAVKKPPVKAVPKKPVKK